jgi:hypothetical protein
LKTTCGMDGHTDECLCDVVLKGEPVEVKYGFHQVWRSDLIMRATGYKEGQGGSALADYLEALGMGYEATRRIAEFDDNWREGVCDPERVSRVKTLLTEGTSIIDLPDILGDSWARIVATLTSGQATIVWSWSEARWARWEDAIRDKNRSANSIGKEFGLFANSVLAYMRWWGVDRSSDAGRYGGRPKAPATKRTLELLGEPGGMERTARSIAEQLNGEGFPDATHLSVIKVRKRWRDRLNSPLVSTTIAGSAAAIALFMEAMRHIYPNVI